MLERILIIYKQQRGVCMKNKKGQGISINTIIIAIIALVVLVLLIAIFTGKMGQWVGGLSEGEEKAYGCYCVNPNDDMDERCGLASPGEEWNVKPIPSECGERFSDCFNTCYEKPKDSE